MRRHLQRHDLAAMVALLVCLLWLPPAVGPAAGLLAALGVRRWLPAVGRRSQQDEALHQRVQLPLALDVLALALDAGVSWDRAVAHAADCCEGAIVEDLRVAAARLALGAAPSEVWRGTPTLQEVGVVVERSFRSGAAVSGLLRQHADALRAQERLRRIEQSRRLGSKVLMPVSFLGYPAFVMLGLVPVLVSTVSTLGISPTASLP